MDVLQVWFLANLDIFFTVNTKENSGLCSLLCFFIIEVAMLLLLLLALLLGCLLSQAISLHYFS
jgi:hypothetical protein